MARDEEAERSFTQDYEDDFDDEEEEESPNRKADASADFEDEFEGSSVLPADSAVAGSPSAASVPAQKEASPSGKADASADFEDDFDGSPAGPAASAPAASPSLAALEDSVSPVDKLDATASFAEDFEEESPDATPAASPEKAEISRAEESDFPISRSLEFEEDFEEEQQGELQPTQPTEYSVGTLSLQRFVSGYDPARDRLLDQKQTGAFIEPLVEQPTEQTSPEEVPAERSPATGKFIEPLVEQPTEQSTSLADQTSLDEVPAEVPPPTEVLTEQPLIEQPPVEQRELMDAKQHTSTEEVSAERPQATEVLIDQPLVEQPEEDSAKQAAAIAPLTDELPAHDPPTQQTPEEESQPAVSADQLPIWTQWEMAAQRIGGVWKGSKVWEDMQAHNRSLGSLEPPKEIKSSQRQLKPLRRVASAPSRKQMPRRKWEPPDQWDARHHLVGSENEALPKSLRAYFSCPKSVEELKYSLAEAKQDRMVKRLEMEEQPSLHSPPHCSVITADAGPSIMISPGRHRPHHGRMKNHDGQERAWNRRHHVDVYNDGLHPLHRKGFAQGSLFELSKSQRWRRIQDLEVSRGCWDAHSPPVRFPPLGV